MSYGPSAAAAAVAIRRHGHRGSPPLTPLADGRWPARLAALGSHRYNWIDVSVMPLFSASVYGVAVSSSPAGPFALVTANVTSLAWSNTGDFGLFLDPSDGNGTGRSPASSHSP